MNDRNRVMAAGGNDNQMIFHMAHSRRESIAGERFFGDITSRAVRPTSTTAMIAAVTGSISKQLRGIDRGLRCPANSKTFLESYRLLFGRSTLVVCPFGWANGLLAQFQFRWPEAHPTGYSSANSGRYSTSARATGSEGQTVAPTLSSVSRVEARFEAIVHSCSASPPTSPSETRFSASWS